jgi:Abortive infection C-terminus
MRRSERAKAQGRIAIPDRQARDRHVRPRYRFQWPGDPSTVRRLHRCARSVHHGRGRSLPLGTVRNRAQQPVGRRPTPLPARPLHVRRPEQVPEAVRRGHRQVARPPARGAAPGAMAASVRLDQLEDWEAVRRTWDAALAKVVSDPEGAITATRTTLESICKHICDERGAAYNDSGDLAKLYKAAAAAMDIAPDQYTEQVIKQILSGVGTVVNGLAAMRNSLSDSHGRGQASVRPAPRHAKLAITPRFRISRERCLAWRCSCARRASSRSRWRRVVVCRASPRTF